MVLRSFFAPTLLALGLGACGTTGGVPLDQAPQAIAACKAFDTSQQDHYAAVRGDGFTCASAPRGFAATATQGVRGQPANVAIGAYGGPYGYGGSISSGYPGYSGGFGFGGLFSGLAGPPGCIAYGPFGRSVVSC